MAVTTESATAVQDAGKPTITTTAASHEPPSNQPQHATEGKKPSWTLPASSPMRSHLEHIHNLLRTASSEQNYVQKVQPELLKACTDGSGKDGKSSGTSLDALHAYMADPASHAVQYNQDLDLSAPITDYFISSSHNTYLTGNQLYSSAAAKSYTDVLSSGCRCVEIDVWDGGAISESDGDESPSDSDSEKEEKPGKPKTKGYRSKLNSLSTKFGGLLGYGESADNPADASAKQDASDDHSQQPAFPEPIVLHGHTFTKATTFREVCEAIRDSAFVASDLPVIVSLEVNASLEQQAVMVDIIEEVWKGLLVEYTSEQEATDAMPTLGDLKRKILIKVKWVAQHDGDEAARDKGGAAGELGAWEKREEAQDEPRSLLHKDATSSQPPPPKKPSKILGKLSELAIFTKAIHFRDFMQPEAKVPGHVFSLSEKTTKKAHESYPDLLFEHNRRYFMRVYPSMTRITSSNLDPTFCWRRGVQMAALNWQSLDEGTMLNYGMFGGGPGWVLKPPGYRSSDSAILHRTVDLTIQAFAGHGLASSPGETDKEGFCPYIRCQLHVEQLGEQSARENTSTFSNVIAMATSHKDENEVDSDKGYCSKRTKASSGINPDFGGEELQLPRVSGVVQELSFVRFKVKDDKLGKDPLAAWACIRLDRLREGYRLVQLQDYTGEKPGGVILIKVTKNVS